MSKEYLKALEELRDFRYGEDKLLVCQTEMYNTIKQALQRLESIDNAKPSEALKDLLKVASKVELADADDYWEVRNAYTRVDQALQKAQETEKILKIVFKKRIDIDSFYITFIKDVFDYNYYKKHYGIYGLECLTQEEFNLIKEMLK